MDSTEQPQTEQETSDICQVPVWRLKGVNIDNMDAVLRTNAWIHYSDLADDGWGLVCSQKQAQSWQKYLRRSGITIHIWRKLPYRPWDPWDWKSVLIVVPLTALLALSIDVTMIFGGVAALILLYGWNTVTCRQIRIAPGLKSVLRHSNICDNVVYPAPVDGNAQHKTQ